MSLQNNPFFLLKISCDAGRREILAAVEELSFFLDPAVCTEAQNALITNTRRLRAELDWFPDVDSDQIQTLRDCVENQERIPTDSLSSLSRLNADLYNLELSTDLDTYDLGYAILEIDAEYSALDVPAITEAINRNRTKAKLASVQESDVSNELTGKRDEIKQILQEKLDAFDEESVVDLITTIADKYIASSGYDDGAVLSDVLDLYEVRIQSVLESYTEEIKSYINHIRRLSKSAIIDQEINALIKKIKKWDSLAQPLQLKSKASGMPHSNSEELGREIRNLSVFLHNEQGRTGEALMLVKEMKSVFAELSDLAERFESDSVILADLYQEKQESKRLKEIMDSVKKESHDFLSFTTTPGLNSFIALVREYNNEIKKGTWEAQVKINARLALGQIARNTAIQLNNNKHQPEFAYRIITELLSGFGDIQELNNLLRLDKMTLARQLGYPIGDTEKSGQRASAIPRDTTPSDIDQSKSQILSSAIESDRSNKWKLIAILIAIFAFVIYGIISAIISSPSHSSNSRRSTNPSRSSYSTSTTTSNTNKNTASSRTYTITLDKDGGTGGTNSVPVKYGESMPAAKAPTKEGYMFCGYYSSSDGAGDCYYNANMESKRKWDKKENATIYAYWILSTYTVTLDDGMGGKTSISVEYGHSMPKADIPTRQDYVFKGYYVYENGNGKKYYDENMKSVSAWDLLENKTLYAFWEEIPVFTVTLEQEGGTGGTTSISVEYLTKMPAADAPSKYGYVFMGYFSKPNGEGAQYYDENMESVQHWNNKSDGTLYAYWKRPGDLVKPEEEPSEVVFSSDLSIGTMCYEDIVSIFPTYGIYTIGASNYTDFVCECKTKSGGKVWLYMTVGTYRQYFDSSASTSVNTEYADQVDLYPAKRIHGKVILAKDVTSGMPSITGNHIMKFLSMD